MILASRELSSNVNLMGPPFSRFGAIQIDSAPDRVERPKELCEAV